MDRHVQETPARLVTGGVVTHGAFRAPVRDVNILEAGVFGQGPGRAFWKTRLKEWCGIGFVHPDWYLSVMIQDAKYLSSGVVYLWDRHRLKLFVHGWTAPGRTVTLAASQYRGVSRAVGRNFLMEFDHAIEDGFHGITIDVAAGSRAPAIRADLVLHEDLSRVAPLSACLMIDRLHHVYTHKAPMGISGRMTVDGQPFQFDPGRDTANMDEHKAVYPYHTGWLWGSFAGRDGEGRYFGVNLADHMFADQDVNNENCVWLGAEISLLGRVRYLMDPARPFNAWKIRDENGLIDLQFHPVGRFVKRANLLVAGIDYYQMFGTWSGSVVGPDGARHDVPAMFGVAERMDTRF